MQFEETHSCYTRISCLHCNSTDWLCICIYLTLLHFYLYILGVLCKQDMEFIQKSIGELLRVSMPTLINKMGLKRNVYMLVVYTVICLRCAEFYLYICCCIRNIYPYQHNEIPTYRAKQFFTSPRLITKHCNLFT